MRGLDPGCCFPADCSRTSTSQATSHLWQLTSSLNLTSILISVETKEPQPQRPSASTLQVTLVGREVFSVSSSSLLEEGVLLCKLWPIDLCLKAFSNPPRTSVQWESAKVTVWQCQLHYQQLFHRHPSSSTHLCVFPSRETHFQAFSNFGGSVKAVSADTSTCHFWQWMHLLVTVWSLKSATWDERTWGESLRARKDR